MQTKIPASSSFRLLACFLILAALMLIFFPRLSQATEDTEQGKQLFEKRCTGCHSLDQDKEGPRLRGVYGRQVGKIATFKYSPALQSAHVVWDDASLEKWLTSPDSLIPDNDMSFRVPKEEERTQIIRFLKSTSGR